MSIRSEFGNFASGVGESLEALFAGTVSQLEGIFSVGGTIAGNLFSGGFVGISEQGLDDLKRELERLITDLEDHIKGFEGTQIEAAITGPMLAATQDYFRAVKDYVSMFIKGLRASIKDIEMAKANFTQGAASIARDITSDMHEVKSAARDLDLG